MYRSRLPRISAELVLALDVAARAGAEIVATRAKDRVPVDTGKLREAIHVAHADPGQYEVVAGNTEAFYGHIVEHGGAHTPPRPFLVPALEESRAAVIEVTAAALRKL